MIADRALGLPGRERPEGHKFGDDRRRRFLHGRAPNVDFRPHGDTVKQIFLHVQSLRPTGEVFQP